MTGAPDVREFRRVVGRFASGVTVVSTALEAPEGREHHAMTCSSFASVSLEPLLVLFCAEKIARFHDAVLSTGSWAVSVLGQHQQDLSRHFALRGRPLEGQFDGIPHTYGEVTGAVVLDGAVASLECRTVSVTDAGDHTVVLGEVLAIGMPDPHGTPLLYCEGRYRSFGE